MTLQELTQDMVVQARKGFCKTEAGIVIQWTAAWKRCRLDVARSKGGKIICLALQDGSAEFSQEELEAGPNGPVFISGFDVLEIAGLTMA